MERGLMIRHVWDASRISAVRKWRKDALPKPNCTGQINQYLLMSELTEEGDN